MLKYRCTIWLMFSQVLGSVLQTMWLLVVKSCDYCSNVLCCCSVAGSRVWIPSLRQYDRTRLDGGVTSTAFWCRTSICHLYVSCFVCQIVIFLILSTRNTLAAELVSSNSTDLYWAGTQSAGAVCWIWAVCGCVDQLHCMGNVRSIHSEGPL